MIEGLTQWTLKNGFKGRRNFFTIIEVLEDIKVNIGMLYLTGKANI